MPTDLRSLPKTHGRRRGALVQRLLRAVACFGLMGGLTACPEDDDPAKARLAISASPFEQRVAQGATTVFTVNIQRTAFTGPVSLSVAPGSLPLGISIEFDPQTLSSGTTQAIARVTLSADAPVQYVAEPPSEYIRVVASGPNGLTSQSTLIVRPVPSTLAGITLNAAPGSLAIGIGEVGQSLVTIARQGKYAGAVTVAASVSSLEAFTRALIPTITPVDGVPDTWLLKILLDNSSVENLEKLFGVQKESGPIKFKIRATPQGLAPIDAEVSVTVVLPYFSPVIVGPNLGTFIAAGEQTNLPIALGRSKGFNAAIAMSASSSPEGISGTFSPNPAIDDFTNLTLAVGANVPPGEYVVTVKGTPPAASGAAEQTLRVPVTVRPPTPPQSYTLTVPNLTVVAGSAAAGTVNLTRAGGFTGPVRVALARAGNAALPLGMSLTPDQIPVAAPTNTLSVGTTTATPPGVYNMTATGTNAVLANVVSTFTVTVTAPPTQAPRPTTISVVKLVNGSPQLTTAETVAIGSEVTLIPVVLDQNQQPIAGVAVRWQSANAAVATVVGNTDGSGKVRGERAGFGTVVVQMVDAPNLSAAVTITVPEAPPISNVARIELEPKNAEITSPATQQYRVSFFDATGARMSVESGGVLEFTSTNLIASNPPVASISSTTGLATGLTAGGATITANYRRNGVLVRSDATPLTVYAANSAGHYGSATISTNGETRSLRPAVPLLFQIIVRNTAGSPVTSGVTPLPTVASSSGSVAITTCTPSIVQCQGLPPGYFFIMTAAANATVGSTTRIRYDVMGAGGEITMTITP